MHPPVPAALNRSLLVVAMLVVASGCGAEAPIDDRGTAGHSGIGGNVPLPDAGVPADACAAGFEHDGDAGCVARLPADPCAVGSMALPGETACREVAPCGSGTWGDIPTDANTVYVDQSYVGATHDGSMAQPFLTVMEGFNGAPAGAIVAIAAGSYVEDVFLHDKAVTLWGRCPSMVEIVGSSGQAAILVQNAPNAAIRDLAVRSGSFGIGVLASTSVTIDRVWIHDTLERGLEVQDQVGPASAALSGSLVEQVSGVSVGALGTDLSIDGSVIRDSIVNASGRGRGVQIGSAGANRGTLAIEGSLIEHVHDVALGVFGSDATMNGSALRDVMPFSDGHYGHGVFALSDQAGTATVSLSQSTLERTTKSALLAQGASVTVDATSFRVVVPEQATGNFGRALQIQSSDAASQLQMTRSLVEDAVEVGIVGAASVLMLDQLVVRRIAARQDGFFGDGISGEGLTAPAEVELGRSLIAENARVGLTLFGAPGAVHDNAFRCNPIHIDGEQGFSVDDQGGNSCGCGAELEVCQVVSSDLTPPPPDG